MPIAGRIVSLDLGNGVGNGRLAATLSAHRSTKGKGDKARSTRT
jgi:hypothetical protein